MKWLALLGVFIVAGCSAMTDASLSRGTHVQAHGKLFMNVTDLSGSPDGQFLRFVDGGVLVYCTPAACAIGKP